MKGRSVELFREEAIIVWGKKQYVSQAHHRNPEYSTWSPGITERNRLFVQLEGFGASIISGYWIQKDLSVVFSQKLKIENFNMTESIGWTATWKYTLLRTALAFFLTFLAAFSFLLAGYENSYLVNFLLCLGFATIISILITVSRDARCVLSLCLPQIFTGICKDILLTCLMFLLMSQPIYSIMKNMGNVESVGICMRNLTESHANQLNNAMDDVKDKIVQHIGANLEKFEPLNKVINGFISPVGKFIDELDKLTDDWYREVGGANKDCHSKINKGRADCSRPFDEGKVDCKAKLKGLSAICDVVDVPKLACGISDANVWCSPLALTMDILSLMNKLKTSYATLVNYMSLYVDPSSLIISTSNLPEVLNEFKGKVETGLKEKFAIVIYIFELLYKIMGIPFIVILPVQAYFYRKNTLDQLRQPRKKTHGCCKRCGQRVASKKRGIQKKNGFAKKCNKGCRMMGIPIIIILMTAILVILAIVIHVVAETVLENSKQTISFHKDIHFKAIIKGGGLAETVTKAILSDFEFQSSFNFTFDISECLVEPTEPINIWIFCLLICLILAIGFLAFVRAWLMVKRFDIIRFFYPEEFTGGKKNLRARVTQIDQSELEMVEIEAKQEDVKQSISFRQELAKKLQSNETKTELSKGQVKETDNRFFKTKQVKIDIEQPSGETTAPKQSISFRQELAKKLQAGQAKLGLE